MDQRTLISVSLHIYRKSFLNLLWNFIPAKWGEFYSSQQPGITLSIRIQLLNYQTNPHLFLFGECLLKSSSNVPSNSKMNSLLSFVTFKIEAKNLSIYCRIRIKCNKGKCNRRNKKQTDNIIIFIYLST